MPSLSPLSSAVTWSPWHEAPISGIAIDFGTSEPTLHNWLKTADVEDGARPGIVKEAAELRDARERTGKCNGATRASTTTEG